MLTFSFMDAFEFIYSAEKNLDSDLICILFVFEAQNWLAQSRNICIGYKFLLTNLFYGLNATN